MSDPRYWAERLQELVPLAWDPRAREVWAYTEGAWSAADHLLEDRLPALAHEVSDIAKLIMNAKHFLRSSLIHNGEVIDPSKPADQYIAIPKGLYDIESGETRPSDSDWHTLYQLSVDPVFDGDTPLFDHYLTTTFHEGDAPRVLDLLAYSLAPGNPRQEAVMLVGSGGNGKGLLLRVLSAMFRDQDVKSVALQAMAKDTFAARELYGCAVNVVAEMGAERITDSTLFKSATGEDRLRMNKKYGEAINARVWAHHWFSVNEIPSCSDSSDGWVRRWQVVEFPNTPDKSDTTFEQRLMLELPAIVGKLLRRLTSNRDGRSYLVRETSAGTDALRRMVDRSNSFNAWLSDGIEPGHYTATELRGMFTDWAIEEGLDPKFIPTRNAFAEKLRGKYGAEKSRNGKRGWTFKGAKSAP